MKPESAVLDGDHREAEVVSVKDCLDVFRLGAGIDSVRLLKWWIGGVLEVFAGRG